MKKYYLYILADKKNGSLHIDITDDLKRSVCEFKMCENVLFKSKDKYSLVYYEEAGNIINAIKMKKKLEKWDRYWKETLIEKCNPLWEDLLLVLDSRSVKAGFIKKRQSELKVTQLL